MVVYPLGPRAGEWEEERRQTGSECPEANLTRTASCQATLLFMGLFLLWLELHWHPGPLDLYNKTGKDKIVPYAEALTFIPVPCNSVGLIDTGFLS